MSSVSVVIPTYRRDRVLVETIGLLLPLIAPGDEIVVVDQEPRHDPETTTTLKDWQERGAIRWIVLARPSIPAAMNCGLREARSPIVLFLDDDIVPGKDLLEAHRRAQAREGAVLVAGRVVQPWDRNQPQQNKPFLSLKSDWITEFIGCNFSVKREAAFAIGGFDENFVKAAYRYEKEISDRLAALGITIYYEPEAQIEHLKVGAGGTRELGAFHYNPGHGVGEYYFLLRSRCEKRVLLKLLARPFRAVRSRYHLRRPWMIPVTLAAELIAFFWAVGLSARGPRLVPAAAPPAAREPLA